MKTIDEDLPFPVVFMSIKWDESSWLFYFKRKLQPIESFYDTKEFSRGKKRLKYII